MEQERRGDGLAGGWLSRPEGEVRRQDESSGPNAVRGLSRSREETLAAWVGPERRAAVFAGLRPLHDDVSTLVDRALSGVDAGDALMLSRLEAGWGQLFDRSIAEQCRPLSVKGGHLKIEVGNSTYLYVFERQHKGLFLRHVSEFSGGRLKSVEFVPRGVRRWGR